MTEPNPFSTLDSLNHLINPKIVTGATGYEVQVDIANVDTFYGRQLGGTANQFAQGYIQQIGTTGFPSQQAFIQQIGTTGFPSQQAFINNLGSASVPTQQAFINTIGSEGSSGDGYFNTVHWRVFDPPLDVLTANGITLREGPGIQLTTQPSGHFITSLIEAGSGISLNSPADGQPFIISSTVKNVVGSTGIRVDTAGLTSTLSSTVAVTGSTFISIQQSGATFTVTYTGSQGSSPPTGVSGAYSLFNSSGNLTSSTVLNSTNIVGPTGSVMLYSPQGPTYRNSLYLTDGAFPTLVTPYVSTRFSNGNLSIVPFSNQNYIESSGTNAQAFPLQISGGAGTPILTTFDIPQGLVTINPGFAYPSGVDVVGTGSATQQLFYSGGTYNVYLWGGGGDGSSFSGGAGGFVKVQNIYGATGITFSFNNAASVSGGGNALGLFVDNGSGQIAAAVAPGGGGGGTAGPGAAYGEPGGSYPGQGFSAGNTGGIGGIFESSVQQTTHYTLGSTGVTVTGGIFENVPVQYGLTGFLSSGTQILGYGVIPNVIGATFTSYYFPPGSTLVFQTNGITFENSIYNLTGITGGIMDPFFLPEGTTLGGLIDRVPGGTASSVDTTGITGIRIQGGFVHGLFTGDSSGIDQMLVGQTFSMGQTGLTLTVNYGTTFVDSAITGGIQIDFSGGLTFSLSRSLGQVVAPRVYIQDPLTIAASSIVQVAAISETVDGNRGTNTVGGSFAGGAGDFGGGGGVAGGGGGAGSAIILAGFSGVTGAGSGTSPFADTYNLAGSFGFGGSGGAGGQPYYVIEKVDSTLKPDVLTVNGNETINGGLTVDTGITIEGPANSSSLLTTTTTQPNGAGQWRLNVRNGLNVGEGLSGADAAFSGSVTTSSNLTVGGRLTFSVVGTNTSALQLVLDSGLPNLGTPSGFSGYFTLPSGLGNYIIRPPTGYYVGPSTLLFITAGNTSGASRIDTIGPTAVVGTDPTNCGYFTVLDDNAVPAPLFQYFWLNLLN